MAREFKAVMKPVVSSNIKAIGFDENNGPGNTNLMRVEFVKGSIYDYYPVPKKIYTDLIDPTLESAGTYFTNNVIKNKGIFSKKIK